MYYVCILENTHGKFYIGQTDDLARRIEQHNNSDNPKSKYTVKNGPWQLVHTERFGTRSQAMVREKQIKSMKSSKWIRENLLNC